MRVLLAVGLLGSTILCALAPSPAAARWYGSTLKAKQNATYGCDQAAVMGPLGGVQLSPTGQTSCTYRHGGYLFRNRPTFLVPSTGRVTAIRIRSGPHPARLRLTVLTSSSRVDTFNGQDVPGTYTCCTARYVSRSFRVRPNRITTKKVNVRVFNVRDKRIQYRIHSSDGLALSATGRGTLPLHVNSDVGAFSTGAPVLIGYFPGTRRDDPRVDGYSLPGIDLLFQWNFKRR